MPASEASLGYGSKFEITDTTVSPSILVEMAEVFEITPPSFESDDVDVTHMQSPNRTREQIPGLVTPGECSFQMNYVPNSASDQMLLALRQSGSQRTCVITFPNGVTWTFLGAVKGYEVAMPVDDKMTATVTMQVSGDITPSP